MVFPSFNKSIYEFAQKLISNKSRYIKNILVQLEPRQNNLNDKVLNILYFHVIIFCLFLKKISMTPFFFKVVHLLPLPLISHFILLLSNEHSPFNSARILDSSYPPMLWITLPPKSKLHLLTTGNLFIHKQCTLLTTILNFIESAYFL